MAAITRTDCDADLGLGLYVFRGPGDPDVAVVGRDRPARRMPGSGAAVPVARRRQPGAAVLAELFHRGLAPFGQGGSAGAWGMPVTSYR